MNLAVGLPLVKSGPISVRAARPACGRGLLVKHELHLATASPCSCRCWTCEDCAKRRQWQLIQDILSGHPERFLTLTVGRERGRSPDERARILVKAFQSLILQVRRRWKSHRFQYVWALERHQDGEPHMHVLLTGRFIPQAWISTFMKAACGGRIVDIRKVREQERHARYLSKYLSKAPHRFEGCKRYSFSQGWRPVLDDEDRPRRDSGCQVKWFPDGEFEWAAAMQRRGWLVWTGDGCWYAQHPLGPQAPPEIYGRRH